jgi:inner membrane protein involved in colicin E2 resistance
MELRAREIIQARSATNFQVIETIENYFSAPPAATGPVIAIG